MRYAPQAGSQSSSHRAGQTCTSVLRTPLLSPDGWNSGKCFREDCPMRLMAARSSTTVRAPAGVKQCHAPLSTEQWPVIMVPRVTDGVCTQPAVSCLKPVLLLLTKCHRVWQPQSIGHSRCGLRCSWRPHKLPEPGPCHWSGPQAPHLEDHARGPCAGQVNPAAFAGGEVAGQEYDWELRW